VIPARDSPHIVYPSGELHGLRPIEPGLSFAKTGKSRDSQRPWHYPSSDRPMSTVMFEDVGKKKRKERGGGRHGLTVKRDRLSADCGEGKKGDGSMDTLPGPAGRDPAVPRRNEKKRRRSAGTVSIPDCGERIGTSFLLAVPEKKGMPRPSRRWSRDLYLPRKRRRPH